MPDLLRTLRPYLLTLAISLAVAPTLEECGTQNRGGGGSTSCAPTVAFFKPARGRVVDVKTCESSFWGVTSERTYVKIKATWPTKETVWVVDTQGGCSPGDDWDVYEPQGPARCG
jgi:hypothetical protein